MTRPMNRPAPVTQLAIPDDWDTIDGAWMSAAICHHHPDAEVDSVAVVERDDGTNRRARLAVSYVPDRSDGGPISVFAKADEPKHLETHIRTGNLVNEPLLFACGVDLPVEVPTVYTSLVDEHRYVLLMEDLHERGADPRDSRRPMTVDQVAHGVDDLARLHRQYRGTSDHRLDWVQHWRPTEGFRIGLGRRIPIGLERGGDRLPAFTHDLGGSGAVDLWARYVGLLGHDPTLLHGDAHIGNTYVLPDDRVGFLDWQVVRIGNWSQDLGYFVQGSLVPDDCRRAERGLVARHRRAYTAGDDGVGPTEEEAWLWYRASAAYGLPIWLSTLGSDGYQRQEVSLLLAQRYAAAFEALDTLGAIVELEHRYR
jgi:hypothetical protein